MVRSATGFVKNVVKAKIENIYAIALALLVLVTAVMDPYISSGIAAALLVASATYKFADRLKQEKGYLNG